MRIQTTRQINSEVPNDYSDTFYAYSNKVVDGEVKEVRTYIGTYNRLTKQFDVRVDDDTIITVEGIGPKVVREYAWGQAIKRVKDENITFVSGSGVAFNDMAATDMDTLCELIESEVAGVKVETDMEKVDLYFSILEKYHVKADNTTDRPWVTFVQTINQ